MIWTILGGLAISLISLVVGVILGIALSCALTIYWLSQIVDKVKPAGEQVEEQVERVDIGDQMSWDDSGWRQSH